jgi:Rrf2 family iron-sulfur cluster assembly transcriptional regulator
MRISRSTGYGLVAVGYIAKHQEQDIILSQTISKEYNIPLEYLLKILQQLVRAGVLRSKRGPRGGFSLAKPTKKITMLQVIEAVDGPMISQTYEKAIAQARSVFEKAKLSEMLAE